MFCKFKISFIYMKYLKTLKKQKVKRLCVYSFQKIPIGIKEK